MTCHSQCSMYRQAHRECYSLDSAIFLLMARAPVEHQQFVVVAYKRALAVHTVAAVGIAAAGAPIAVESGA